MYILQIENLYKKYNHTEAIKNITLNINQGEIYGLLGPNGAGKSTLIKMIAGIEKMDSGNIMFEEKETNIKRYRKYMGIISQDIAIYPSFTARENISFFCSLYGFKGKELKKRVDRSLEFVGLLDCGNKKAEEFSGGMRRRLHLACAIAHTPKLVIMDEPTVGIDPQSRNHILESVKKLNNSGTTIIYTSHYMDEIETLCDKICILDKGEIIAKGSSEYLKNTIMNKNIYVIELKNNINNPSDCIKSIKGVEDVKVQGNIIRCSYYKNVNILQKLVNVISNNGGTIKSIKNEIPTLETVFLTLTGKNLRD